jgi:hypothetical protein
VKIFEVEVEDDMIYIQADTQQDAKAKFNEKMGDISVELLTWKEVESLPDGEEFL